MAGTIVVDTIKSSTTGAPVFQNTSGTEIGQLCRAWVNFNGSTGAIRAQYNVSSVTRNGVGNYTINFSNAMADVNYAVCTGSGGGNNGLETPAGVGATRTTTAVSVGSYVYNSGTSNDIVQYNVAIFR